MKVFTLSFLLSLVVLQYSSEVFELRCLLLALLPMTLVAVLFGRFHWRRIVLMSILLILGAILAVARLWISLPEVSNEINFDALKSSIQLQGEVLNIPQTRGSVKGFNFRISQHDSAAEQALVGKTVRLKWYKAKEEVRPGQIWVLQAKLKPIHGFANPGTYDEETAAFIKGIDFQGYVQANKNNHCVARCQSGALSLAGIRYQIKQKLSDSLAEYKHSGLITALVLGERGGISRDDWQLMARLGISHLMAISGLHVGMVAGVFFACGLFLFRRSIRLTSFWPHESWAAALSIIAAVLYALLAGLSLPTQRAVIMVSVAMLSIIFSTRMKPWRLYALAVLCVLLLDPWSIQSYGFWLSFGAVAWILFAFAYRQSKPGGLKGLIQLQWVLGLGLLPLSFAFFQQSSVAGFFVNLFMIPLVSVLVLPFSLLGLLFLPISPSCSQALFSVAEGALAIVWPILQWIGSLELSFIQLQPPSALAIALALIGMLLLMMPRGIPGRSLAVILLMPLLFQESIRPDAGEVSVDILDVGQGLSVLVQTQNHSMVYDPGPKYGRYSDAARRVVIPVLAKQGVDTIELLVVSHSDSDHSGGLKSMIQHFPGVPVVSGTPDRLKVKNAQLCQSGQSWTWDSVRFDVLSPFIGDTKLSPNDRSCVIQISTDKGKLLLTGDIEAKQEAKLVARYGSTLRSNVLLAPHHGSSTSSSHLFIDTVKPAAVIYSAGFMNRYGMPGEDVVSRYQKADIEAWSTAEQGAIRVSLGKNVQIESYRARQSPLWRVLWNP